MTENFRTNKTKAALLGGETLKVAEINRIFDPAVVELAAQAGFDYVCVDMQHGMVDRRDLLAML